MVPLLCSFGPPIATLSVPPRTTGPESTPTTKKESPRINVDSPDPVRGGVSGAPGTAPPTGVTKILLVAIHVLAAVIIVPARAPQLRP